MFNYNFYIWGQFQKKDKNYEKNITTYLGFGCIRST